MRPPLPFPPRSRSRSRSCSRSGVCRPNGSRHGGVAWMFLTVAVASFLNFANALALQLRTAGSEGSGLQLHGQLHGQLNTRMNGLMNEHGGVSVRRASEHAAASMWAAQGADDGGVNPRFQVDFDILINDVDVRVLVASRNCTTFRTSLDAASGADASAVSNGTSAEPVRSVSAADGSDSSAVCTPLTFPMLERYFPQILDTTRRFEDATCFCLIEERDMVCSCDKVHLRQNETVDFGTELYGTCEKQCASSSSRPAAYNRCFVECKLAMARTYRRLLEDQYENGREQLRNITLILAFTPQETFANASHYVDLRNSVRALEATSAAKSEELEKAMDAEIYWLKIDDRLAAASALEQRKVHLLSERDQSSLGDFPAAELQQKLRETQAVLQAIQQRYATVVVDGYFDPVGDARAAQVLAVQADCRHSAAEGARKASLQLRRVLAELDDDDEAEAGVSTEGTVQGNSSRIGGQNNSLTNSSIGSAISAAATTKQLLDARVHKLEHEIAKFQARAFQCRPQSALAQSLRAKVQRLLKLAETYVAPVLLGTKPSKSAAGASVNADPPPVKGAKALRQLAVGAIVVTEQLAQLSADAFDGAPCEISIHCGYAQICDRSQGVCRYASLASGDTGSSHSSVTTTSFDFSSVVCNSTADCPNGARCLGHKCGAVAASTPCSSSGSCAQGYLCEGGLCGPVFGQRGSGVVTQGSGITSSSTHQVDDLSTAPAAVRCLSNLDCAEYQSCHNASCVQQSMAGARCLDAVAPARRCGNSLACGPSPPGTLAAGDVCAYVPPGGACSAAEDSPCADGAECLLGKCRNLFRRSHRAADSSALGSMGHEGPAGGSRGARCTSTLDCGQFERCSNWPLGSAATSRRCVPVDMFSPCRTNGDCGNDQRCSRHLRVCVVQISGGACDPAMTMNNSSRAALPDDKASLSSPATTQPQVCPNGQVCRQSVCRQAWDVSSVVPRPANSGNQRKCQLTLQCGSSQVCREGRCQSTLPSASSLSVAGSGRLSGTKCTTSAGCGNGELCAAGACIPIPDGAPCDENGDGAIGKGECGRNMQCRGRRCRGVFGPAAWAPPTIGDPCLSSRSCGPAQVCDTRKFQCTAAGDDGTDGSAGCETSDADCGNGQICLLPTQSQSFERSDDPAPGQCANVSAHASCSFTRDCGNQMLCVSGHCMPLYHTYGSANTAESATDAKQCFTAITNMTVRRALAGFLSSGSDPDVAFSAAGLGSNEIVATVCERLNGAVRAGEQASRVTAAAAAVAATSFPSSSSTVTSSAPTASGSDWNPHSPALRAELQFLRSRVLRSLQSSKASAIAASAASALRRNPLASTSNSAPKASLVLKARRFEDDAKVMRCLCGLAGIARRRRSLGTLGQGGPGSGGGSFCLDDLGCEAGEFCEHNACVRHSHDYVCGQPLPNSTHRGMASAIAEAVATAAPAPMKPTKQRPRVSTCGNGEQCVHGKCRGVVEQTPCTLADDVASLLQSSACGRNQECLAGGCAPLYGSGVVAMQLRQMQATFDAEANTLRAEIAAKANAMSGDLKAMLEALLAQLARLRAERERLEALIRAYEEAEMARLRQMIAELLAQLNKLKAALKDLQDKAASEAAARLAHELKLLAALRKEAATRQSLSATMKNMNDAANLLQMRSAIESLLNGGGGAGGVSSAELRRLGQQIAERRAAIEGERRRWEVAVVRLARPKTCAQLLGLATGGLSGKYTVFPPSYARGASMQKDYGGVEVYCDMTTDGGGWTLLGYGANASLSSRLALSSSGHYDALRRNGSANINSLWLVQSSREMALSWTSSYDEGANRLPSAEVLSYQHAVKFQIPNAHSQTLAPEVNVAYECRDPVYAPTRVTCLAPASGAASKNNCGYPRTMYTGTDSLGVCFGHAYGLVTSVPPPNVGGGPVCGWTNQPNYPANGAAVYMSFDGTSQCNGVVLNNSLVVPMTMAVWVR